jgi:hypothetical protein
MCLLGEKIRVGRPCLNLAPAAQNNRAYDEQKKGVPAKGGQPAQKGGNVKKFPCPGNNYGLKRQQHRRPTADTPKKWTASQLRDIIVRRRRMRVWNSP